ncbi:MAG: TetR/AcrR family transcriptional regulator [Oleiphilaceae bacterium]|nr:TetR/AcrR family transcriptional regulator [Oleiphilaceae bacterium]
MGRIAQYDRQAALDSAINLFWEKGYSGSSMKQIEQALDMRPGSLYATFGSKDGLFSEALDLYSERNSNEMSAHLENYESIMSGMEDYLRKLALAFAPGTGTPSRACLIVKTLLEISHRESDLGRQVNRILDSIEERLREALEQAAARGELKRGTDCARLARLLQSQIIGLRSYAQRETSALQVAQLGEDMAAILAGYRS